MPVHENPNPLAERFLHALRMISRLQQHTAPVEMVADLSVNQIRTLYLIHETPGINQKDVAEKLSITAAAVSIGIKGLIELDLVEKKTHEDDARVTRLVLREKGDELIDKIKNHQAVAISKFLDLLPEETQATIIDSLEHAIKTYHKQT